MFRVIAILISTLLLTALNLQAADHVDATQITSDPSADINDVFLFVNPNDADELIIANTSFPIAGPGTQFSDAVTYNVVIENDADDEFLISCTFEGGVTVTCNGPDDMSVSGPIGSIITNDDIRVFAGLRDDPFFFDLQAFAATAATGTAQFSAPGSEFFLGLDTLAIVIGVSSDALTNDGENPVLEVYGTTVREEKSSISNAFTGFFVPQDEQDNEGVVGGQGIFLEVLPSIGSGSRLGVGWLTYTPTGDQLYLIGSGGFDGDTATISLVRTDNGSFPGTAQTGLDVTSAGTLTVDLTSGCNLINANFDSDDNELPSIEQDFIRLTEIQGLPCNVFATGQVDRMGRGAINTALVDLLGNQPGAEDEYNQAVDRDSWPELFQSIIQGNIEILDTLDGIPGNTLLPADQLAAVLVDDVLLINTSIPTCGAYLAVELGIADQCGGRVLELDVIDASLGALVGPGVSDFVDLNSVFLDEFPFLGAPNSMTGNTQ